MNDVDVERPFYTALGRILRERRKAVGLTQAAVARASGVNHTIVCNVENGHPRTMLSVIRIANELEIEPAALLRQAAEEAKPDGLAD